MTSFWHHPELLEEAFRKGIETQTDGRETTTKEPIPSTQAIRTEVMQPEEPQGVGSATSAAPKADGPVETEAARPW